MDKHPVYNIVSRIADVRPKELSSSLFLFFYFFLVTSVIYIVKPVKISLYLERLSFGNLPWAYLITALVIGFFISLNSMLLQRMNRSFYISLSLVFFILTLFVFWWLFKADRKWPSLVFWLWADIFTAMSMTQFWILVKDIFDSRQIKRLVGFLASGGLLGGIAGAFFVGLLAGKVKTEDLLLACPLVLTVSLILLLFLRGAKSSKREPEGSGLKNRNRPGGDFVKSFHIFIRNRHLIFLGGIMASAIIVTTLIDFQFNGSIERKFADVNARTAFLGAFFALLLIFSYLLHVLTTNRLLKNIGMQTALAISPLILLVGSAAVFILPSAALVYWAISLKGADKSLSHSLSKSIRELLYVPVSPEIKNRTKIFVDMFVNKFARALAAMLLLLFFSLFHFSLPQTSLLVIFFIFVWLGFNRMIGKEYVNLVKRNLQIKWQDADKFIDGKIDVDMTKLVFDTLQSKAKSSVLYAMNLFDLIKRENMSPEMKKIIVSQSGLVLASSMDSLLDLDGEGILPEMDDAIEEDNIDEQVKEILSLEVYKELMSEKIEKIIRGESPDAEVAKMEAAKVIGMMEPSPQLYSHLKKLLIEDSPDVLRYAIETAGKLKRKDFVPLVVVHLKKAATRSVASQSLAEHGEKILGSLKDYLTDGAEDIRIRKAIPDIMSQIGTQRAADMMVMELKKRMGDVESELIEAMYRLRKKNRLIRFQNSYIEAEIGSLIKKSYMIIMEMHELMPDEKRAKLVSDLENNLASTLKNIFNLLSLIYPVEDVLGAYRNFSAGTKKSISDAIELCDVFLEREVRELIIPLMEDVPISTKVIRCRKMLKHLERREIS
jgi:AAA family ATP:ADP antiporter